MSTEETKAEWLSRHPPLKHYLRWTRRRLRRERVIWNKIAREIRLGACWSLRWNAELKHAEDCP